MSEENLFEMITLLVGEVRHLRRLLHLQHAEIQALRIYAVAKIADSLKRQGVSDREKEFAALEKIVREIYDEHISSLEEKFPAIATDIDLRAELPPDQQALWYLLEKYYPPNDGGICGCTRLTLKGV